MLEEETVLVAKELGVVLDSAILAMGFADVIADFCLYQRCQLLIHYLLQLFSQEVHLVK